MSVTGTLFCLCATGGLLIPALANTAETGCRAQHSDETVRIRYVHDGDTVWLTDGRKVRIIGINTPELARDNNPAEPLAIQARDALRTLIAPSPRIQLRYGKEKTDRYGRLLAHLYLNDGRNISAWLLRQGLALSLTVPPNLRHIDCYRQAEQQARQQQLSLWSKKYHRVLHTDTLPESTRGFQIIRGQVQNIGHSRRSVWLNFAGNFAVRVAREDLPLFKSTDFKKLIGKQLEVRGWVQYHKHQLRMRIRHPAAMQILP